MRALLCSIVVVACAAAAHPAGATVRWADPDGSSGSATCATPQTACRLDTAISAAVVDPGDEVILKAGTYDVSDMILKVTEQLDVHGAAGASRPVLEDDGAGPAFTIDADGSSLRFVEIRSTSTAANSGALAVTAAQVDVADVVLRGALNCVTGDASAGQTYTDVKAHLVGYGVCVSLAANDATVQGAQVTAVQSASAPASAAYVAGGVIEDSTFTGQYAALSTGGFASPGVTVRRVVARGGQGLSATGSALVTDSVFTADRSDAAAVRHLSSTGSGMRLRNVTAVATADESIGLWAMEGGEENPGGSINARNVIARGTESDLRSEPCPGGDCYDGVIAIGWSNYRTFGGDGVLNVASGIQSGDPRFVAPGNFRLADDSPAIDAGIADALGPVALDGAARVQGAAVDIGAYERAPATPQTTTTTTPVAEPDPPFVPPPPPPPPPPVVTARDTAAPVLTGIALQRRTLRLSSSEAGTLRVTVARRRQGRLRSGRCVIGRRRGAHCVRHRQVKAFTVALAAGQNAIAARTGSLRPGRYRLTVVARDAAGNPSAPRYLVFKVKEKQS